MFNAIPSLDSIFYYKLQWTLIALNTKFLVKIFSKQFKSYQEMIPFYISGL